MKETRLAFLLLLLTTVSSWEDCGSNGVKIKHVQLMHCPSYIEVCQVSRGSNETLTIQYTPLQDFANLTVIVNATVAGISRYFPLEDGFVCDRGTRCPLKRWEEDEVHLSFFLKYHDYYDIYLLTKWQFLDYKSDVQACFKMMFQIVH